MRDETECPDKLGRFKTVPKKWLLKLRIDKSYTTTFDDLAEQYIENFKHQRSFNNSKKYGIEQLKKDFSGRKLSDISYYELEKYRIQLRNTLTKNKTLRKNGPINIAMVYLHHMLSKACEWGMMEVNPFDRGRSFHLKENNQRLRFLTEDEIVRLLESCPVKSQDIKVGKGGSLRALSQILGHANIKMTMRYAHLSKEFAKQEIQIMNSLTTKVKDTYLPVTRMAQTAAGQI